MLDTITGFLFDTVLSPTVIGWLTYALSWLPWILVIIQLVAIGKWGYNLAMAQYVVGEPNEWVVIMRDGEPVNAGIGLSCFKTPWDSVAKFPSKLTKVEVSTMQITLEMQGVQVNSMIEWTIDRNAPLKAYKNLDLASGNTNVANDALRCMTSAIVRNQVANSDIDTVIKNRQALKELIVAEMNTVVVGWGVHLATVEITDVRILSSSLFKDMQSKFREENNKKATLERMVVENTIYFDRLNRDLESSKRQSDTQLVSLKAQQAEQLKQARRDVEEYRQHCALEEKEQKRTAEQRLREKNNNLKLALKKLEVELASHTAEVDQACRREKSKQDIQQQQFAEQRAELEETLKKKKLTAENERALKQANYDLLKEGFKDPVVSKLKYMEVIGDLYQSINFSGFNLNHMGKDDPIARILSTFSKMAEDVVEEE